MWSPALVVFVGGGQPGMSAWFPLGPGEAYRPWYRCSSRYVDEVNISNIRPAPRVVVQKTYVNIVNVTNVTKVTNITYVNRTAGVTAVRQEDFGSGRPVSQVAVRVNAEQMARGSVIVAPQAPAKPVSIVRAPVAKAVPVATTRPVLINEKGQMIKAQPHAQAVAAPVKPVEAPKALPGRTVVAAPPNAKVQQAGPGGQPKQGGQPGRPGTAPGTNAQSGRAQTAPNQQPASQPQGRSGQTQPGQAQQPQPKAGQPVAPAQPLAKPNQLAAPAQPQVKPNQPAAPAQPQPKAGQPAFPAQPLAKPNQPAPSDKDKTPKDKTPPNKDKTPNTEPPPSR